MWVPDKILQLFDISKSTVDDLRQDLAATRMERDSLQRELTSTKINSDWLRLQFNTLQLERTALMEKAYGIKLPVPELMKTPTITPPPQDFSFDDVGESVARQLGLPAYAQHATV